jgi:hypothetical protein
MALEVLWLGLHRHQWRAQLQHGRKAHRASRNQAPVKMVKLVRGHPQMTFRTSAVDVICERRPNIVHKKAFKLIMLIFQSNYLELSGSSSPLNHSSMSDKHKPTVEKALNSLTSEMVRVCYTDAKSIRILYKSQDL